MLEKENLFIESLNQTLARTTHLLEELSCWYSSNKKLLAEKRLRSDSADLIKTSSEEMIVQTFRHVQMLGQTLVNAVQGENIATIKRVQMIGDKRKEQQAATTASKRKLKAVQRSLPVSGTVSVLRSLLDNVSISLFRLSQDTYDLVSESIQISESVHDDEEMVQQQLERKDLKQKQARWQELANRVAREKEMWLESREEIMKRWIAIEEGLTRTATSMGMTLHHDCSEQLSTTEEEEAANKQTGDCRESSKSAEEKQMSKRSSTEKMLSESSDHISVFEAVAVKKVPRSRRTKSVEESDGVKSTGGDSSSEQRTTRVHLNDELSTVLTNREKLPEMVRKIDRSGWSETKDEQMRERGEVEREDVAGKQEVKPEDEKKSSVTVSSANVVDHNMNTQPTPSMRPSLNIMAELQSALRPPSEGYIH